MKPEDFWVLKLVALLHDPWDKVNHLRGHAAEAEAEIKRRLGPDADALLSSLRRQLESTGSIRRKDPKRYFKDFYARADHLSAGADRTALSALLRTRSTSGQWQINTQRDGAWATHPLGGPRLGLFHGKSVDSTLPTPDPDPYDVEDPEAEVEQADVLPDVQRHRTALTNADAASLERLHFRTWRLLADEVAHQWPEVVVSRMPADSRAPDHSMFEHARMTSAAAFLTATKSKGPEPDAQTPWLVVHSVGPVHGFIRRSRKTRDLWFSSYILAELALASMTPIVESLGPDAILYPDLRGNPRFDRWLIDQGYLTDAEAPGAATQAAVLPNRFVALVPRGGAGALGDVSTLAARCRQAVVDRWRALGAGAKTYLATKFGSSFDATLWDAQLDEVFRTRFAAIPWHWDRDVLATTAGANPVFVGHGLPVQRQSAVNAANAALPQSAVQALQARSQRYARWLPKDAIDVVELQRQTLALSRRHRHLERGFDYPLVHGLLRARAKERDLAGDEPRGSPQAGEKCMSCHERTAVGAGPLTQLDAQRESTRKKWQKAGYADGERLCAVCAVKRFGSHEGRGDPGLVRAWGGTPAPANRDGADVPFPSTAMVAAHDFIERIVSDPAMAGPIASFVASLEALGPEWRRELRTQVPASFGRITARAHAAGMALLAWESQVLFPETLDAVLRGPGAPLTESVREATVAASKALRAAAAARHIAPPDTHFALIKLDAVAVGQLLVGMPDRLRTPVGDLLHPAFRDAVSSSTSGAARSILAMPRLISPTFQAFVSSALAEFAHKLVPWVVEAEHSGRVIYAGGDDALLLCPAADALAIVARLDQLVSAPWVIDTKPALHPWAAAAFPNRQVARARFAVPRRDALEHHLPCADLEGWLDDAPYAGSGATGPVIAMLGQAQTLRAGIVMAHFKTDLGLVVDLAAQLADERAGDMAAHSNVSVAVSTRGGIKYRSRFPLGRAGRRDVLQAVTRVRDGLEHGRIPAGLPYKLEPYERRLEAWETAKPPRTEAERADFMEKALAAMTGEPLSPNDKRDLVTIWETGFRRSQTRSADLIRLCRAMANLGDAP